MEHEGSTESINLVKGKSTLLQAPFISKLSELHSIHLIQDVYVFEMELSF